MLESKGYRVPSSYAVLGITLWFIPLFNLLHAESSAVVAGMAFFASGFYTIAALRRGERLPTIAGKNLLWLFVPWGMLTLSLFWVHNCSYWQGLGFFLLFAPPSAIFGVALAFLVDRVFTRWKRLVFASAGLFIGLSGVVYDLGFHAQFFTYNHVFGGVMGPIYDEELSIRGGLVVFRLSTLVWAGLCIAVGRLIRPSGDVLPWKIAAGAAALALLGVYAFSAPLRLNSPAWYVQDYLGGHAATEHFDVYYAPESIDSLRFVRLLEEQEYRYAYLRQHVRVDVGARIQTYLYPDPETKDYLTGARNTSVAPVWLKDPQMHIVLDHFDGVFAHELGHVFSREFGLPVLNASLSVGLVEGVAVAFEPSDMRPHPHEQVLSASMGAPFVERRINAALTLKERLSPLGFWTGRGAVSYTTMGSFVRFLVDAYGVEPLKRAYPRGDFEGAYGKSVDELVDEWEAALLALPAVSRSTYDYVTHRFAIPSIFEKECPHHVAPAERHLREGGQLLAEGDTTAAIERIEAALQEEPLFQDALDGWAQLEMMRGGIHTVVSRLSADLAAIDSISGVSPGLWVRLGDALALAGRSSEARNAYGKASGRLPLYAQEQHGFIALRQELADWPASVASIYSNADAQSRLDSLERIRSRQPLVGIQQAYLLVQEGRLAEAIAKLETVDPKTSAISTPQQNRLERLRLMALAQTYALKGDPDRARPVAESLAKTFKDLGAFQEEAFYTDFAGKMRYIDR